MGVRKTFELLGPAERAILEILWREGLCSLAQIREQRGVAPTTAQTTLGVLLRKGFVTYHRDERPYTYTAVPRAVLLHAAIDKLFGELGATAAERAHILEALRHG